MQLGNKGEAYLEVFLSNFCLTHKIARSNDIGIDFFCEWFYGESPTSLLFAIQVKTLSNPGQKR